MDDGGGAAVAAAADEARLRSAKAHEREFRPETLQAARARVVYDEEHGVLVCVACAAGVALGLGVQRHFKDYYGRWPLAERQAIAALASRWRLVEPEHVSVPELEGAAVGGLAVYEGWRCRRCGWLCPSEATMRMHCRQAHG
jgi:hypothetical protein